MPVPVRRLLGAALVAAALGLTAGADEYLCDDTAGCVAELDTPEGTRTVTFRQGDMINTDDGWVVDTADGWSRLD